MPPAPWAVPDEAVDLYAGYLDWLAVRGVGNRSFLSGARGFLVRHPDPQAWAALPLAARLAAGSQVRPFLNFLMLHGHLRPGYDYLLERKLHAVLRDAAVSPLGTDLARFLSAAEQLGYSVRVRRGIASEIAVRVLIQSARRWPRFVTTTSSRSRPRSVNGRPATVGTTSTTATRSTRRGR